MTAKQLQQIVDVLGPDANYPASGEVVGFKVEHIDSDSRYPEGTVQLIVSYELPGDPLRVDGSVLATTETRTNELIVAPDGTLINWGEV